MNPQSYWPDFFKKPSVSAEPRKLLVPGGAVFTMGSCFALEVRRAMTKMGFATYPAYSAVTVEPGVEMFDKIPQGQEMPAHYDTFTMRQEFEAAFGIWNDREAGYWEISGRPANNLLQSETVYQDPFRKAVFAHTRERLVALSNRITDVVREGIDRSNVIVLTLGLTEVWQHKETGRYICRPPNAGYGGGKGLATFQASKFLENYENVKAILDLLFARYPDKHVVISVSPVRLEATYRPLDVGTANLESKSILRAVAGQIASEYPERVLYFPSYEIAMLELGATTGTTTVFEEDGRHVQPTFVQRIIEAFVKLTG
jgi:hypothetical protein